MYIYTVYPIESIQSNKFFTFSVGISLIIIIDHIVPSTTEKGFISTFSYCVPKERETLDFYHLFIGMELRKNRDIKTTGRHFLLRVSYQPVLMNRFTVLCTLELKFGKCNGHIAYPSLT